MKCNGIGAPVEVILIRFHTSRSHVNSFAYSLTLAHFFPPLSPYRRNIYRVLASLFHMVSGVNDFTMIKCSLIVTIFPRYSSGCSHP
jgi:hypothetical protein